MPDASVNQTVPAPAMMRADLLFLLKASRPGFWSTSVWFYMLPLGQQSVFGAWTFWLGLFYVTFPLGFLLYGWNDLADHETDRRNPRKDNFFFGARGTDTQLAQLPRLLFWAQVPFAALFIALLGRQGVVLMLALIVANALYNGLPNGHGKGCKTYPPLDLLNQVGYLLVFVLSSWLNHVPQLPAATFVFGALFAMHSHLFGQIMDVVPDRLGGRRTTATIIGVRAAKWLLVLFLLAETLLLYRLFAAWMLAAFLFCGALWFVFDVTVLFRDRDYPQPLVLLFAVGLNVAAIGSLYGIWSSGCLAHLHVP